MTVAIILPHGTSITLPARGEAGEDLTISTPPPPAPVNITATFRVKGIYTYGSRTFATLEDPDGNLFTVHAGESVSYSCRTGAPDA